MKNFLATASLLASLSTGVALAENTTSSAAASPATVLREYLTDLQTGRFPELMALLADDVIWHQPGHSKLSGTYEGKEAVGKLFAQFMDISAGSFKITGVDYVSENGSLATASLRFSAKRCQYFEVAMDMKGIDLMRVEEGLIKEVFLFSENQEAEDRFWGVATWSDSIPM